MPLTKIACPECGSSLTSAAGYVVGRTATCGKCEAEFVVQDPAMIGGKDELDAPPPPRQWSYRTSTLRYVVLVMLVGVLGVLGYMLYEKKNKEREDARTGRSEGEGEGEPADKGPEPAARRSRAPVNPIAMPAFSGPTSPADALKQLTGTWEWNGTSGSATVEYGAGGEFTYTSTGPSAKSFSGGWTVGTIESAADKKGGYVLPLRWTVRGGNGVTTPPNSDVEMNGDKLERHPLIHLPDPKAVGSFVKKK